MLHDDNYRRSDWVKMPEQIDSYVEGFVKRIEAHYPNKMMRDHLVEKPLKFLLIGGNDAAATLLIANYVCRDSKVTLDKIADYCIDGNMNCEHFLYRAINEHVDNAYQLTKLKIAIADMKAELERERQKLLPFWKRVLGMFK